MKAIPAESGTSDAPVLHLICSAEKLPSIIKVRMSCFLWKVSMHAPIYLEIPYKVYLVFQSSGRLIPGCGQAGQKMAIDPSEGDSSSCWCPRPLCILFLKSLHWRDTLRSCLYRFCEMLRVCHVIEIIKTYRDIVREHPIGYALKL